MIPQRRFLPFFTKHKNYNDNVAHTTIHLPIHDFPYILIHRCSKNDFPRITTTILEVHTDEVWNLEWSHDGNYLASAGKDKSAIIWRRGVSCFRLLVLQFQT
jgi:WD40 repeat protein